MNFLRALPIALLAPLLGGCPGLSEKVLQTTLKDSLMVVEVCKKVQYSPKDMDELRNRIVTDYSLEWLGLSKAAEDFERQIGSDELRAIFSDLYGKAGKTQQQIGEIDREIDEFIKSLRNLKSNMVAEIPKTFLLLSGVSAYDELKGSMSVRNIRSKIETIKTAAESIERTINSLAVAHNSIARKPVNRKGDVTVQTPEQRSGVVVVAGTDVTVRQENKSGFEIPYMSDDSKMWLGLGMQLYQAVLKSFADIEVIVNTINALQPDIVLLHDDLAGSLAKLGTDLKALEGKADAVSARRKAELTGKIQSIVKTANAIKLIYVGGLILKDRFAKVILDNDITLLVDSDLTAEMMTVTAKYFVIEVARESLKGVDQALIAFDRTLDKELSGLPNEIEWLARIVTGIGVSLGMDGALKNLAEVLLAELKEAADNVSEDWLIQVGGTELGNLMVSGFASAACSRINDERASAIVPGSLADSMARSFHLGILQKYNTLKVCLEADSCKNTVRHLAAGTAEAGGRSRLYNSRTVKTLAVQTLPVQKLSDKNPTVTNLAVQTLTDQAPPPRPEQAAVKRRIVCEGAAPLDILSSLNRQNCRTEPLQPSR